MSSKEYLRIANDEVLVAVQVETKKAVTNIEDIVSVEWIDATFIGSSDLSASMGHPGDYFHTEFVKAMRRVVGACEVAGVAPGIAFGTDVDHVNSLIEDCFRFIGIGSDTGFLSAGCRKTLRKIRK